MFLDQLPLIERVTRAVCSRRGFNPEESEEFESWVKLRLIEADYVVLRKFRGRSSLSTYLTVVIQNLSHDFLRTRRPRFRPSIIAKRLGTTGMELERLTYHEGLSHDEAIEVLISNHHVRESRKELIELIAQLPQRLSTYYDRAEGCVHLTGEQNAEDPVHTAELTNRMKRVGRSLRRAQLSLSDLDRLILRMRFEEGLSLATISRFLSLNQRSLYTRVRRVLDSMRETLEQDGLTWNEVSELIGWDGEDDNSRDSESSRRRLKKV